MKPGCRPPRNLRLLEDPIFLQIHVHPRDENHELNAETCDMRTKCGIEETDPPQISSPKLRTSIPKQAVYFCTTVNMRTNGKKEDKRTIHWHVLIPQTSLAQKAFEKFADEAEEYVHSKTQQEKLFPEAFFSHASVLSSG